VREHIRPLESSIQASEVGGDVAKQKARETLLSAAPTSEGDAQKLDDLLDELDVKKTLAIGAIQDLIQEGLFQRIGAGVKGDPYRYWRPIIHSPAPRDGVPKERKERASTATQNEVRI